MKGFSIIVIILIMACVMGTALIMAGENYYCKKEIKRLNNIILSLRSEYGAEMQCEVVAPKIATTTEYYPEYRYIKEECPPCDNLECPNYEDKFLIYEQQIKELNHALEECYKINI